MNNLLSGMKPFLLLCTAATAFALYWHWATRARRFALSVMLACPLAHIFMHHGHDHGPHGDKDAADAVEPGPKAKGE
jgi:Protein of unknown function (DUF2933)